MADHIFLVLNNKPTTTTSRPPSFAFSTWHVCLLPLRGAYLLLITDAALVLLFAGAALLFTDALRMPPLSMSKTPLFLG